VNVALSLAAAVLFFSSCSAAYAAERMRFWNLTTTTIIDLQLSPAGTGQWGSNQCENDPDKSVESDERLTITGVKPGRYDIKLGDKTGRTCLVRNVELVPGRPYAFSISDKDLTQCEPQGRAGGVPEKPGTPR
jgi:hypothetical protein